MTRTHRFLVLAVACLLASAAAAHAATPDQKCRAGIVQAKEKYEACVDKFLTKFYSGSGAGPNYDENKLAKCRIKYDAAWLKLQTLVGTQCDTLGRFNVNGDGTVTDHLTGLIWEVQDDLGGLHDKDNTFTWSTAADGDDSDEDGTVFTTQLATLNGGCFAGACGWRLPTFAELQTILLPELVPCSVNPCIDPAFGAAFGNYWSSTTFITNDGDAWLVNFSAVVTGHASKDANMMRVRAVRGGY